MTKAVAVAAGLGFVLGLALVLLVVFLGATRRPRVVEPAAPATRIPASAAAAEPTPVVLPRS